MRAETDHLNARAVAAWSGACLVIVLATTNPVYKTLVLAAALAALVAGAGFRRTRRLLLAAVLVAAFAVVLNLVSAHIGATVLFTLPAQLPAIGGPYTLEAGPTRSRRWRTALRAGSRSRPPSSPPRPSRCCSPLMR